MTNMGQEVGNTQIGEMSFWKHLNVLRASLFKKAYSDILVPKSKALIIYTYSTAMYVLAVGETCIFSAEFMRHFRKHSIIAVILIIFATITPTSDILVVLLFEYSIKPAF